MKKTVQLLSVGIILISLFSSCSVEKRRYMPGYHIQWKNSKPVPVGNEFVQKIKAAGDDKKISDEQPTTDNIKFHETVTASAGNSTFSTQHRNEKSNHPAHVLQEECDVIILKNGDEIKAKVSEISPDEIKYKKCDEPNGLTYSLRKSEVFMIKYPNGTKDLIHQDVSAETNNKPIEEKDSGIFGILSFVCASIGLFSLVVGIDSSLSILSLFLFPLAVVFGGIGIGRRRKLKGLAIVGLLLGMVFILILIIFLLTFRGIQ